MATRKRRKISRTKQTSRKDSDTEPKRKIKGTREKSAKKRKKTESKPAKKRKKTSSAKRKTAKKSKKRRITRPHATRDKSRVEKGRVKKPSKKPAKKLPVKKRVKKPGKKPATKLPVKKRVKKPKKGKPVVLGVWPIPSWAGRPPAPEAPEETPAEPAKRVRVYHLDMKDFGSFVEPDKEPKKGEEKLQRYMTSTTNTSPKNRNYLKVFEAAFRDYTAKTQFTDLNDIPIFRYGIAFRTFQRRSAAEVSALIAKFEKIIQTHLPEGATAHIVNEEHWVSVRLNFGDYRRPSMFTEAREEIANLSPVFDNIISDAWAVAPDVDWFEFWDTEELYY